MNQKRAQPFQYTNDDLWDRYFKVRMSYLQSRSVDYIRQYGIRISDNEEVNKSLDGQEIITQLNINSMFEKWRTGVTIHLVNYPDCARVYDIIHSHLVTCAEFLRTNINNGGLPLKDLVELDEFATKVYDKAKPIFTQQERVSALATNFQNVQAFNFSNILKRSRSGQTQEELTNQTKVLPSGAEIQSASKDTPVADKNEYPDRVSYRDMFAEDLARIQGWRGKM